MKLEHLTNANGTFRNGRVVLDSRRVFPHLEYTVVDKKLVVTNDHGETVPYNLANVKKIRTGLTGNIRIFRAGKGAKAAGFNPNQWFFVIGDRVYSRTPGNGQRGQFFVSAGKWHTNAKPVRGKKKTAVLAATA